MKLFVLLGILFSFSSFSKELKSPIFVKNCKEGKKCVWIEEIRLQYDPSFECNVESLNKDIESYIKFMYSKLKEEADKGIYALSHEQSNTAEENIRFSAYKHYIKQCDNFTDFVSEQELGHPDILGKQKLFAVEKNLLYILRVVTKEKDIETLKKLINQGLDIDVLFELTERRGLPYMDDSPPSYNIYGWMDVNKEDSKEEALAKNAFQRLLIELGSKGRDVDYRSI